MQALMSARVPLLVGESESLPIRRALATSRAALLHTIGHCMSPVEQPHHGSLTLSSVGFQTETEPIKKFMSSKIKPLGSSSESLKGKVKNPSFGINERKNNNKQKIEAAPFAANSFSELGLPHVLIERAARSWGCDPFLVAAKKVVSLDTISPSEPVSLSRPSSRRTSNQSTPSQASVESLAPALKHYYCVTRLQHKVDALRRCIHALDAKTVIVFMNNTKQLKDAVFKLEARGVTAAELHGDLGKLARSTTLKKFKNGEVRVLVTNELSARGLDVVECDLVVNLDLSTDSTHYAH